MYLRCRWALASGVLYPPGMVVQNQRSRVNEERIHVPQGLRRKKEVETRKPTETPDATEKLRASVKLTAEKVLQAISKDSGRTSQYYAQIYFNQTYSLEMKMLLWGLKKKGEVHFERDDDGRAIWFPRKK